MQSRWVKIERGYLLYTSHCSGTKDVERSPLGYGIYDGCRVFKDDIFNGIIIPINGFYTGIDWRWENGTCPTDAEWTACCGVFETYEDALSHTHLGLFKGTTVLDPFTGKKEFKWIEGIEGSARDSHNPLFRDKKKYPNCFPPEYSSSLESLYGSHRIGIDMFNSVPSLIIEAYPYRSAQDFSFLFEDGEIIKFSNCDKHLFRNNTFFAFQLSQEEFVRFKEKVISIFRITYGKTDKIDDYVREIPPRQHCFHGMFEMDLLHLMARSLEKVFCEIEYHFREDTSIMKEIGIDKSEENITQTEACYLYLMRDSTNNAYKIGISKEPRYRERTLQSDKPFIEMLACKEYPSRKLALSFEKALHKTYESNHIRGEWFSLSDSDAQLIIEMLNN